jgi:hypothetical protein
MSRAAVEQLVYLLDEAFEGKDKPWHSMLGNLASVTEEDWLWTPPDGARMIRTITGHVGGAVYLYHDRTFGGGTVFGEPAGNWNVPAGDLGVGAEDLDSVIDSRTSRRWPLSSPGSANGPESFAMLWRAWMTRPSRTRERTTFGRPSQFAGSSQS